MGKFAELLRFYRDRAGLSQRDFLELAGISHSCISQCEAGKVGPPLKKLAALARALRLGEHESLEFIAEAKAAKAKTQTKAAPQLEYLERENRRYKLAAHALLSLIKADAHRLAFIALLEGDQDPDLDQFLSALRGGRSQMPGKTP